MNGVEVCAHEGDVYARLFKRRAERRGVLLRKLPGLVFELVHKLVSYQLDGGYAAIAALLYGGFKPLHAQIVRAESYLHYL